MEVKDNNEKDLRTVKYTDNELERILEKSYKSLMKNSSNSKLSNLNSFFYEFSALPQFQIDAVEIKKNSVKNEKTTKNDKNDKINKKREEIEKGKIFDESQIIALNLISAMKCILKFSSDLESKNRENLNLKQNLSKISKTKSEEKRKLKKRCNAFEKAQAEYWPINLNSTDRAIKIRAKAMVKVENHFWLLAEASFPSGPFLFWTLKSVYLSKLNLNDENWDIDGSEFPKEIKKDVIEKVNRSNFEILSQANRHFQDEILIQRKKEMALKMELLILKERLNEEKIRCDIFKEKFSSIEKQLFILNNKKENMENKIIEEKLKNNDNILINSKNSQNEENSFKNTEQFREICRKNEKIKNDFLNLQNSKNEQQKNFEKEIEEKNEKIFFLEEKIKSFKKSENRLKNEESNHVKDLEWNPHLEYLKNCLIEFISKKQQRTDLFPVIAMILRFSEEEKKKLQNFV